MGLITPDFGTSRCIVVVDERTYRGADRAVLDAVDEVRTGRKGKRIDRARRLEQAEMCRAELAPIIGLAGT
jgi:hypothetical protein